jgi:FHA domain
VKLANFHPVAFMSFSIHETHSLVIEDDNGSFNFPLNNPTYSIGRDPACDVRLVSQFVSRFHATLVQVAHEDGNCGYKIVDGVPDGKTSANGLLINGRKLRSHILQHQDQIIFGPKVSAIYLHSQYSHPPDDEPDDFGTLYAPSSPRNPAPSSGAIDPHEPACDLA